MDDKDVMSADFNTTLPAPSRAPAPRSRVRAKPFRAPWARAVGLTAALVLALLGQGLSPAPSLAATDPGPELLTPTSVLDAALSCPGDLATAAGTPVLLVHGTSSTPTESWAFGYARVLPTLGHPTCTIALPDRAWNDIQASAEYVVHAIRVIAARSGRKVSVIGHSEGTMQPLWGLRFWPDLAAKVDDYIALAPPLQGTVAAGVVCSLPKRCPAAVWQYRAGSAFVAALNREPLPSGPSYTAVATLLDELVVPQPAASRMPGVDTAVVQKLCPGRVVAHAGLLGDAAAFAIARDALDHPGPADLARINRSVCLTGVFPGIDLPGYAAAVPVFVKNFIASALTATWVTSEPPVRAYATTG